MFNQAKQLPHLALEKSENEWKKVGHCQESLLIVEELQVTH